MKLMEIIPGVETDKEVVDFMVKFSEEALGKGVVICKDTPNFVGNRIGCFDMSNAGHIMLEKKMKVTKWTPLSARRSDVRAPQSSGRSISSAWTPVITCRKICMTRSR
jgi:hypothetical protein